MGLAHTCPLGIKGGQIQAYSLLSVLYKLTFKLLANAIWSVPPVLINESETYCIFYLGESSRIMLSLLLSSQSAIQERILYSLMCLLKFDCKKAYDSGHSQPEFQFGTQACHVSRSSTCISFSFLVIGTHFRTIKLNICHGGHN